jgi:hypothetical protein
MPDTNVNIIDLDPVISTNDSDQFVVVQGTEGRRIALSGIADYTLEDRILAKSNSAVTSDSVFPMVDDTTDTAFNTTPEDISRFAFSDGITSTTDNLDSTNAESVNGSNTIGARNADNGNSSRITFNHLRDHVFSLEYQGASESLQGTDDVLLGRGNNTRVKSSVDDVGDYVLNESTDGLPNASGVFNNTEILVKIDGDDLEYATPSQMAGAVAYNFLQLGDAVTPLNGTEYLGISQFGSGRRVDIDDLATYVLDEGTEGLDNLSNFSSFTPVQVMAKYPGQELEYITPDQIRDEVFDNLGNLVAPNTPLAGDERFGMNQFGTPKYVDLSDIEDYITRGRLATVRAANQTVASGGDLYILNATAVIGTSGTVGVRADIVLGDVSARSFLLTAGADNGIADSTVSMTYKDSAGVMQNAIATGSGGRTIGVAAGEMFAGSQVVQILGSVSLNSSFNDGVDNFWIKFVPTNGSMTINQGSIITTETNGISFYTS